MAKLVALPDRATIMAMRGHVDYYLWAGRVPVARTWPRRSVQPRTAGEIASSNRFTAMTKIPGASQTAVIEAYKAMIVGGVGVTWQDAARAVVGGRPWITLA